MMDGRYTSDHPGVCIYVVQTEEVARCVWCEHTLNIKSDRLVNSVSKPQTEKKKKKE